MAIQIDEKLLSETARKALSNAKSKSKLLRDALEAYVRNEQYIESSLQVATAEDNRNNDDEIMNELSEIKKLIIDLSSSGISLKNSISANVEKQVVEVHNKREESIPKKDEIIDKEINIEEKKPLDKVQKGNEISEDQKKKIEQMYDNAIMFDGEDEEF